MISENTEEPIIDCITPPSVDGLHITLCTSSYKKPIKLRQLQGRRVSFNIDKIKMLPTRRSRPQNISGQTIYNDGSKYYPTLWVVADVEFVDFGFECEYEPHISLACVAVKLSVDKVDKLSVRRTDIGVIELLDDLIDVFELK